MGKYSNIPSQKPYQSLQFTTQSETMSIPVTFILESPSPGRGIFYLFPQWNFYLRLSFNKN